MQFAQELFKEERLNGKLKYDSKKQGQLSKRSRSASTDRQRQKLRELKQEGNKSCWLIKKETHIKADVRLNLSLMNGLGVGNSKQLN